MTNNNGEKGEPWGVPTETGENVLGEPWNKRRHDRWDKKDQIHATRYPGVPFEERTDVKIEESTLSKPPLISRKRKEALSPGRWRIRTWYTRERQASNEYRAGSEPHRFRCISSRALDSSASLYA